MAFLILALCLGLQSAKTAERECKVHRNVIDAANAVFVLRRAIPEYRNTYARLPERLEQLGAPPAGDPPSADAAGIVHRKFLMAKNYGYRLRYEATDANWRVWVTPAKPRKQGCGSFYLQDDGKIRVRWNEGDALPEDPLMQGRLRVPEEVMQAKVAVTFAPVYPRPLRATWIQGDVEMRLLINQQGKVEKIEVISGDPLLARAAVESVRKWVYDPVVLDGIPVEVETTTQVRFSLSP